MTKYYAKNWVFIGVFAALGLVGGIIYNNFIQTPLYKSSATLLLINKLETSPQDVARINNNIELLKSRRVLEPLIVAEGLDISYDELVKSVDVTNEKNSDIIQVEISTDNPDTSKALVDGAVTSFISQVAQLYAVSNVQVVDDASDTKLPFNVNKNLQLLLATATGLVISCIVLFFIYDFNINAKSSIKKSNKKSSNHPAFYNAAIVLTGRVGFTRPIEKKVAHTKARKANIPAKVKKTPTHKNS